MPRRSPTAWWIRRRPPGVGRTILSEAERLDRLVADLLSLARLEAADFAIELADVDLSDLIRAAELAFAPRCAQHGVSAAGRAAAPSRSSCARIRCGCARSSTVSWRTRCGWCRPASRSCSRSNAGPHHAVVEVRDGGPGLTDDDLAVAFERGALYQRYQGDPQGRQRAGAGPGRRAGAAARWRHRGRARTRGWRPVHGLPSSYTRLTWRFPLAGNLRGMRKIALSIVVFAAALLTACGPSAAPALVATAESEALAAMGIEPEDLAAAQPAAQPSPKAARQGPATRTSPAGTNAARRRSCWPQRVAR